jgi:hypothetical protein
MRFSSLSRARGLPCDAQSGGLTTLWDGALPPGYGPMRSRAPSNGVLVQLWTCPGGTNQRWAMS